MYDQHLSPGIVRRLVAALGAITVLGCTLMVSGVAAYASSNERLGTTRPDVVGDRMERVQKIYRIQPDGTVQPVVGTAQVRSAVLPYAELRFIAASPSYGDDIAGEYAQRAAYYPAL